MPPYPYVAIAVASPGLERVAIPDQIHWQAQTFYDRFQ